MMDLQTINQMSKEAGRKARREAKEPMTFTQPEIDALKQGDMERFRKMPNLGNAVPKGWKRAHVQDKHGTYVADAAGYGAYFVDSLGSGREGEPALTVDQFIRELKPGYGYGIVEVGQFQVKIGLFVPKARHG